MNLGDIKRGTKMSVFKSVDNRATGNAYEAEFKYEESANSFFASSLSLFNNYDALVHNTDFIVAYEIGPMIYTFVSRLVSKSRSPYLVEFELIGNIKAFNRRKREREEIMIKVNIYDLPPDYIKANDFETLIKSPVISDITFDISTGGMCIISNTVLKSKYEPYFLAELRITQRDVFVLPVKLVRRTVYQRTGIGKYDYGFQFLFEHLPWEESRLMSAIMKKKLLHAH